MITPYKIKWCNQTSLEYDLWAELAFDSDNGDVSTFLSKEALVAESYDGTMRKIHGYKYTDVLAPTITFVKQNYADFSFEENCKILSWLTGSKQVSFMDIYHDDSDVISYSLLGNVTECNQYKLANGRIVGYKIVFESISPYGFSPLKNISQIVSNTATFTLTSTSDEVEGLVYPKITITTATATDIAIYNATTMTNLTMANNISGEILMLDGANRVVSSSRTMRIFGNDFNWIWLPLQVGDNSLTVTGNATLQFQWRDCIKCGEF